MSEQMTLSVLYFEDDTNTNKMVSDFLKQNGCEVYSYLSFPAGGIEAIRDSHPTPPDIVITDVNLPEIDGYQICQLLKDDYLPSSSAVVFTSGLMSDEDIMKAYTAGADDYLIKPLRLNELQVKLQQVKISKEQQDAVSEQAQVAMKIAFDAMRNSSELGEILRFQDTVHQMEDFNELAKATFNVLQLFELESSILFLHQDPPLFYRNDRTEPALEKESMIAARGKGRIFSWKQYSFFSYNLFTILIRNMPINDEERYGVLKDQLCLLLNGMDTRIATMMLERSEQEKQKRIKSISQVLANIVLEIEQSNKVFSEQFEKIVQDMETNLLAELAQFNLMESEEKTLMSRVDETITAATALFEGTIEQERQHKAVMDKLLQKLNE